MKSKSWIQVLLTGAIVIPPGLATSAVLAFSLLDLNGRTPFSLGPMRNVAEAAAMGYAADVLRFVGDGADPRRVWPVRADVISSTIGHVTALEAAMWSREVELVQLLDRHGFIEEGARHHLGCLASDLAAQDLVEYFEQIIVLDCAPGEALNIVRARTGGN